jgi:PEGA domain
MAKTESTAVNNLIDLVNSNQRSSKPIVHPDDDLFAAPPSTAKNISRPAIPSILGRPTGGSVPPLPRTRSAGGTSQHTLPEHLPKMRMSTAPPTRGTTIPPIPQHAPLPPAKRSSVPVMAKARMSEPHFTPRAPMPAPQGTPPPELASAAPSPVAPLSYPMQRPARIDMTGDAVLGENWFEASRAVEKFEEETYVGTAPHLKLERERASLVKKLILPALGFMVVGALIGGFIAFNGDTQKARAANVAAPTTTTAAKPTAANAALAANIAHGANIGVPVPAQKSTESPNAATASASGEQPEPPPPTAANGLPNAAAPVTPVEPASPNPAMHDIQTTRGVIHLADVRIDSKPSGASVTLVDPNGKKSFLGTTPLATSVDASHTYDVEVALPGRPEQTAHFDPGTTQHVEVELAKKSSSAARAPAAVAKAPAAVAKAPAAKAPAAAAPKHVAVAAPKAQHVASKPVVGELADPGFDSKPVTEKPEKPAAPAAPAAGSGTLMVASKPPCEILIDGKPTGLSTPQRAMPLPAGAHKVTLVNAGANINKTVMVQINADQSTKLVKDLL